MAICLDGKKFAREIEERLRGEISEGLSLAGRPPGLAVLRVGDDSASEVYVSNKEKACKRIGVESFGAHLPAGSSFKEIKAKLKELNENNLVDGILLQLPLPKGLEADLLLKEIDPSKDADGLHTLNLGKLLKGEIGPRSCTPAGIMALLARYEIPLEGKRAVVVGRSILVGLPMALMLQAANATVSIAHSRTKELSDLTRQADLLVVAAGKPQLIKAHHIRPNCVVVDIGIHKLSPPESKKKLCGDVLFEEVEPLVKAITPVPGGVGPMTVAMLLVNTINQWQDHCGLSSTLGDLLP